MKRGITLKLDRIRRELFEGNIEQAASLADAIDIDKIRENHELSIVADAYFQNREYVKSKQCYEMMYIHKATRNVISRLAHICIKLKDVRDARKYTMELERIDPDDFYIYIYRYNIAKMEGRSLEERIKILEALKEAEYIENWAYELAKLYHKTEQTEKCIAECRDIIIWFGSGEYVERAKALKAYYEGSVDITLAGENSGRFFDQVKEAIGRTKQDKHVAESCLTENYDAEAEGYPVESYNAEAEGYPVENYNVEAEHYSDESEYSTKTEYVQEDISDNTDSDEGTKDYSGDITCGDSQSYAGYDEYDAGYEALYNMFRADAEADAALEEEASGNKEPDKKFTEDKIIECEISGEISDKTGYEEAEEEIYSNIDEESFFDEAFFNAVREYAEAELDNATEITDKENVTADGTTKTEAEAVMKEEAVQENVNILSEDTVEETDTTILPENRGDDSKEISLDIEMNIDNPSVECEVEQKKEIHKETRAEISECNTEQGKKINKRAVIRFNIPDLSEFENNSSSILAVSLKRTGTDIQEILGGFMRIHETAKQIIPVFEHICRNIHKGASLVITDIKCHGGAALLLAKRASKLMQSLGFVDSDKVALITADKINSMNILNRKNQLAGCCVIIENAGELTNESVVGLTTLKKELAGNMFMVLSDTDVQMAGLFGRNETLLNDFSDFIELPEMNTVYWKELAYDIIIRNEHELDNGADAVLEQKIQNVLNCEKAGQWNVISDYVKSAIDKSEIKNTELLMQMKNNGKFNNADLMVLHEEDF